MRWNDIAISCKLLITFGAILFIFVINLVYTFSSSDSIRDATRGMVRANKYQAQLLKAEVAHLAWATSVTNHIMSGGKTKITATTDGHQCSFGKWFYSDDRTQLEKRVEEMSAPFKAIEAPHLALHKSLEDIYAALKQGDDKKAHAIYNDVSRKNLDQIRMHLNDSLKILDTRTEQYSSAVLDQINSFINVSMLIGVIILFGGATLAIVVGLSISRPLIRLVLYAREVAGGNLRQPRLDRKDEVGQLSQALGVMVGTLRSKIEESEQQTQLATTMSEDAHKSQAAAERSARLAADKNTEILDAAAQIQTVVNSLSDASGCLSAQIGQSEKGTSIQAKRIAETVASMESLNHSVIEVATKAQSAEELSAKARTKAEDGEKIVREAINGIIDVQNQSQALRQDMQTLDEHSRAISRIMSVISDIADQTNLLALNAAIEAARAGDAGRGFAVVADEVRKLAEKTMLSTSDVSAAITAIQQSTNKSMQQVDNAVTGIRHATELSERSGEALREIVSMVDGATGQVRAIATLSRNQSIASDAITHAVTEVNTVAHETSLAMKDAANAVDGLSGQTAILSKLTTKMQQG